MKSFVVLTVALGLFWRASFAQPPGEGTGGTTGESGQVLNLIQGLAGDPRVQNFLTAFNASELRTVLNAPLNANGVTIFVPTDQAWTAAPLPTILRCLQRRSGRVFVQDTIKFHIVPGNYPAQALTNNQALITLLGPALQVQVSGDAVALVNGDQTANVVGPNYLTTTRGTVHVIDQVLEIPNGAGLFQALCGSGGAAIPPSEAPAPTTTTPPPMAPEAPTTTTISPPSPTGAEVPPTTTTSPPPPTTTITSPPTTTIT